MAGPRLIVTDLDRTFTDTRLRLVPRALEALRAVRAQGIRTVLATGRTLPELQRKAGLLPLFDGLIAEGGALIGTPQALRPLQKDTAHLAALMQWLQERQILHYRGVASLSISRSDLSKLARYPRTARFQITANRNRADITPRGVHKGSALNAMRRFLRVTGETMAFGDGENDVPLLRAADIGVAVANAVPALRAIADDITRYDGGRGVADYLERNVLAAPGLQHRVIKAKAKMSATWTTSSRSTTSPRSSARATAARSRPSTASA